MPDDPSPPTTQTRRTALDRTMILGLGATGAVPATLALFALYGPVGEILVWTALSALVWIPVALRRQVTGRILHMTLVGLVAGIVTGIIQAAFAHVLFANAPAQAEAYGGAATVAVRMQILGIDIAIGIVWGLVVGLVWAAAARAHHHLGRRRSIHD